MFRFTIREIVLLTLVVAVGVAWWLDRVRSLAEHEKLKAVNGLLEEKARFLVEKNRMFEELRVVRTTVDRNIQEAGRFRFELDGLRPVPGESDYQFPPNYPLPYDYDKQFPPNYPLHYD